MAEQTAALTTEKAGTPDKAGEKSLATRDDSIYIAPPVDIFENEDALIVVVDLPGVDKDGVDIRVEDDILTIKGNAKYTQPATVLDVTAGSGTTVQVARLLGRFNVTR